MKQTNTSIVIWDGEAFSIADDPHGDKAQRFAVLIKEETGETVKSRFPPTMEDERDMRDIIGIELEKRRLRSGTIFRDDTTVSLQRYTKALGHIRRARAAEAASLVNFVEMEGRCIELEKERDEALKRVAELEEELEEARMDELAAWQGEDW